MSANYQDLRLATTNVLVQELTQRTTFLGLIIISENEVQGLSAHKNFKVISNNMDDVQICRVLKCALENIANKSSDVIGS